VTKPAFDLVSSRRTAHTEVLWSNRPFPSAQSMLFEVGEAS